MLWGITGINTKSRNWLTPVTFAEESSRFYVSRMTIFWQSMEFLANTWKNVIHSPLLNNWCLLKKQGIAGLPKQTLLESLSHPMCCLLFQILQALEKNLMAPSLVWPVVKVTQPKVMLFVTSLKYITMIQKSQTGSSANIVANILAKSVTEMTMLKEESALFLIKSKEKIVTEQ